ncbi:ExeM/NucH family extracellular endonuclease [candidate division CSSED10-310 bacterium]|uniref:ExeM/NucH family extracellular endonuclease n=1 Tax=candidate division CSSED10-310 bacterium TaxID=2855610 RepID=A0ABV6Z2V6_UNCC1
MSMNDSNLSSFKIIKILTSGVIVFFLIGSITAPVSAQCFSSATSIHDIQGDGSVSPLTGQYYTIEGVVTAIYQDSDTGIRGFFVQEEESDWDSDPETSEGIFIYDNNFGVLVSEGDLVRVHGKVSEYNGLTELNYVSAVTICDQNQAAPAVDVSLPFQSDTFLERYEGMLVTLPQTLTVTDTYNLGRYGEFVLSNGRLFTPTNIVSPGSAAAAQQAENDLNRILVDDGSMGENPEPIIFPQPELSALNTLRCGYTTTGLTGVLTYYQYTSSTTAGFRIYPRDWPTFQHQNPRLDAPLTVAGSLKVASFNVLNYFNGPTFPTERGADTESEFIRQREKIISALAALEADIIGLIEVENDSYGPDSAIQDLIDGLNDLSPIGTTYDFIDPGTATLGTDAIAVGMLYRTETVNPVGLPVTIGYPPFDYGNRQPLGQTFAEVSTGELLTVVVCHFRAKGCSSATGDNADQGDGQGCWNASRIEAAQEITAWLATDPTASGDSDFLIVGDLNAYAQEDPITTIMNAGYTDLVAQFVTDPYSYLYQGQVGYLDHALASQSLVSQVTAVTEWHINADEPRILDYNEEYKSSAQLSSLYHQDPFRSSDHDPVIIGLTLSSGNLPLDIPDNDATGVQATLYIQEQISISALSVYVDLTHTYIGDLEITLTGPSTVTVHLHDRQGGSTDDIEGWYPQELVPTDSLSAFNGMMSRGTWTLTIRDRAAYDVGRLNDWQLSIQ